MVCIGISSCGSILVTAKIFRIRAYWLPYAMLVGSNFIGQWSTSLSPMVVSEVRGGKVSDLFEVITISDGEGSNYQVKITIQNI